jgi:hypothetical protein
MKKPSRSVYIRYEFSNEAGKPEGGDIFEFASLGEVQEMVSQILKVTQGDGVAVNITVGTEKPFFGMLKSGGLERADVALEMVPASLAPVKSAAKAKEKPAKKKPATSKKKSSRK